MIQEIIVDGALYVIPLLLGVMVHEVAHGWAAEKCGDPTARLLGRITLNPFAHIDLMGTIILPLTLLLIKAPFLFGWAKPVPVRFDNLRGGRKDMVLVSLAGPLSNLLLAVLSAGVYHLLIAAVRSGLIHGSGWLPWVVEPVILMARISVTFNLVLMLVNLLPVPPLDGGHVLIGLLPEPLALRLERLERYGILILLLLIGSGAWGYVVRPIVGGLRRFLLE